MDCGIGEGGTIMKRWMYVVLILLLATMLIGFIGCEDEEKIVGCKYYNHIYRDSFFIGADHDTVHLFIAAGSHEEYLAPVTFELTGTDDYADSMIVHLSVYGVSNEDTPRPHEEVIWRSDTLIIWYSGVCCFSDLMRFRDPQIPATPPCRLPYYRIDHIDIRHANNVVIEPHEIVLR
jgi:hypothetical protein